MSNIPLFPGISCVPVLKNPETDLIFHSCYTKLTFLRSFVDNTCLEDIFMSFKYLVDIMSQNTSL